MSLRLLLGLSSALALACSHSPAVHRAAPPPAAVAAAPVADADGCPMDVPGAKASITQVDGAVALCFMTTGDVLALRARVHQLGAGTADAARAADARAKLEDLPNGVQVVFTPADPQQLDALRSLALKTATELNQGDCGSLAANGLPLGARPVTMKANRVPPAHRR